MKLQLSKALALGTLLAITGSTFAAPDQVAGTQSVSEILQVQRALRARLEAPRGEYSRFDSNSIHKMEIAQDKVFRMLNGVSSLDQLNAEQKTDLSNSLDEVKATLLANESNRMICHRERKTGTNLVALRCETVAQRDANARESDRQIFHDGISK